MPTNIPRVKIIASIFPIAVPALNLQNNPGRSVSGSLGYNLRYWQWKSNIDTVHAGFRAGAAYQSWAAPLDWETDRKSTRLNSSHITRARMPSSA